METERRLINGMIFVFYEDGSHDRIYEKGGRFFRCHSYQDRRGLDRWYTVRMSKAAFDHELELAAK